jgi:LysM repeat protein
MKMLNLFRAKKVRVATARRHAGAAEIDYAEIPEPNMKLSRALLIVLLLHVVAVSGIIAFNVIKTRQSSFVADSVNNAASPTAATVQSTPDSATSSPRSAPPLKQSSPPDRAKPSDSPAKAAGADEHKSDHAKPVEHAKVPASSGKVYTVVKGDSPVKIAKKLKVSYEDLIALNHIEDPRRLKVGQKLLVPKKTAKAKTTKRNE